MAYERSAKLQDRVGEFIGSSEVNWIEQFLPDAPLEVRFRSHYLACPLILVPDRVDFLTADMQCWLRINTYSPWSWQPSLYGVRARLETDAQGRWQPFSKIFRNGAVSHWETSAVSMRNSEPALAYIPEFRHFFWFLRHCQNFYNQIGYHGPLQVQLTIHIPQGKVFYFPWGEFASDRSPLLTGENRLRVSVLVPASDLHQDPRLVLQPIADRVCQAFGIWNADFLQEVR